jgi:hypothetical protein
MLYENSLQIRNNSLKLITLLQSPRRSHVIVNVVRNTSQTQINVIKMTVHKKYQSNIREAVIYTALG